MRYVYFWPCLHVWAILRGLSVSFSGLYTYIITYTSICLQMKVTSMNFFVNSLLHEWKSNRPHPPASHFLRVKSRDAFDRWSRFQTWKNVQLNSTLNWRTLHEFFMYRQHCREFWGWAFDQVNSYTLNVLFFIICSWKSLSAWEFKCRLNSCSSIIC